MRKINYLIWLGKLTAILPTTVRLLLARLLAALLMRLPNRRRDRAAANISRCLPAIDQQRQQQILQEHLLHRTRSLLESAMLWHKPAAELLKLVTTIEGEQVLQTAQARGRGVIVAVPHFGQWELVGLYLSAVLNNTAMLYKPLADPQADARLRYYRERTGGNAVPASATGIKYLLKILQSGGYVGILPDQRPKSGQGRIAQFFGHPAQTMTLLTRIVRKTNCSVVFAGCERLTNGHSFKLKFMPAPFGIDADDDAVALSALNEGVEQCAHWNLAQYQWSYNRFGG